MRPRASIARASDRAIFVYVNDDGSARELTLGEGQYLATEYDASDYARPYIKTHYSARMPDGGLRGYLERRKLPKRVEVGAPADR